MYIYVVLVWVPAFLFLKVRTITLFYSTTKENNNTLLYSNHLLRHHSVIRLNQEQAIDLTIDISSKWVLLYLVSKASSTPSVPASWASSILSAQSAKRSSTGSSPSSM